MKACENVSIYFRLHNDTTTEIVSGHISFTSRLCHHCTERYPVSFESFCAVLLSAQLSVDTMTITMLVSFTSFLLKTRFMTSGFPVVSPSGFFFLLSSKHQKIQTVIIWTRCEGRSLGSRLARNILMQFLLQK